ncbi:hypothetical protein M728_000640 [Ensifer sp. WSM1721]|uniref:hypothetical protein n=1 Tax=Ensifer sp. WSM1721 TaxID=1041159 RepID=UPI0004B52817|nr:hypothetical protein [Ensifer sp. WSM1721]
MVTAAAETRKRAAEREQNRRIDQELRRLGERLKRAEALIDDLCDEVDTLRSASWRACE